MKIRILDDHVINQIAAGEVIENSASVVKELVENSLDASADQVLVEIQAGGRQMIRVSDNGCGMSSDEALLALERHATSKLEQIDDLDLIETMGFRGEAIPSIASISKFILTTSNGKGTMIFVEGGKVIRTAPAMRALGTTIEVKNLFYNVPVRKKFQKSYTYDTNEILKILSKIALASPEIAVKLVSDQEVLLDVQPGTMEKRTEEILGEEFVLSTCPLSHNFEEMKIEGFIGYPSYTRHNRTGQYLFINRRSVYSKLFAEAICEGYGTAIGTQRHPIYLLHVTLAGENIDVNVHPQKREVRLRGEHILRDEIAKAISKTLQKEQITSAHAIEFTVSDRVIEEDFYKPTTVPLYDFQEEKKSVPKSEQLELTKEAMIPKVIGALEGYVLIDGDEEGLKIMDQRRAHHRILYEKLIKQREKPLIQGLLIPYTLEVTPQEKTLLDENLNILNQLGLSIQPFGGKTYNVDGIPPCFETEEISDIVRAVLEELTSYQTLRGVRKEEEVLVGKIALRATILHNRKLNQIEAQDLVKQLYTCEAPFVCPYGKPTVVSINRDVIAKQFMR